MEALALWLVQKTCTTLSANQMQNWRNEYGSTCSVIGPENMHHPLNQSDAKLKQIWKHLLCDWSRKHAPLSQPIRCKIEEMNMEALALWLVQKTCTTLLTNQMQNWNKYGSTCSVIGPENMHHSLSQSDAKLKKWIWKHLLCDWSRKHAPPS